MRKVEPVGRYGLEKIVGRIRNFQMIAILDRSRGRAEKNLQALTPKLSDRGRIDPHIAAAMFHDLACQRAGFSNVEDFGQLEICLGFGRHVLLKTLPNDRNAGQLERWEQNRHLRPCGSGLARGLQ